MDKYKNKGYTGLDSLDIKILEFINKKKKVTITEVKNYLDVTHPTLTLHLKRLVDKKLIERQRDQQTFYLTISGKSGFVKMWNSLKKERGVGGTEWINMLAELFKK